MILQIDASTLSAARLSREAVASAWHGWVGRTSGGGSWETPQIVTHMKVVASVSEASICLRHSVAAEKDRVSQAVGVLLASATFISLLMVTVTQAAPLEESRVHPPLTIELPPFPPTPGAKRYVLLNYHFSGQAVPPPESRKALFLSVPSEFVGNDTPLPQRGWGLNLLVHYPDMTGIFNVRNSGKLGTCAGVCPGEMRISISYEHGSPLSGAASWLRGLHDNMEHAKFLQTDYIETESPPFTRVITEIFAHDPRHFLNKRHFIISDNWNKINFYSECSYASIIHLCIGHSSSDKISDVGVDYTFLLEDLDKFNDIQTKVVELVNSFIVEDVDYEVQ